MPDSDADVTGPHVRAVCRQEERGRAEPRAVAASSFLLGPGFAGAALTQSCEPRTSRASLTHEGRSRNHPEGSGRVWVTLLLTFWSFPQGSFVGTVTL